MGSVLLALVVFNLALLKREKECRRNLTEVSRALPTTPIFSPLLTAGIQPFCFTFLNLETKEPYQPKLLLLIFFSTQDCITCLQETSIWEGLYRDFSDKGLKILGMVPLDDSLQMEGFAEAESLSIPIVYVDSMYIKQRIGIPLTPFKVLLDSSFTVLYLNGPNSQIEDQLRFKNVIERWCSLSL